jgi:alanine or glycine:cation symporter, AGCS family
MADLSMAFMTIVNLVAVLLLSGLVIKLMRDYNGQLSQRVEPVFDITKYPEIARRLVKGSW